MKRLNLSLAVLLLAAILASCTGKDAAHEPTAATATAAPVPAQTLNSSSKPEPSASPPSTPKPAASPVETKSKGPQGKDITSLIPQGWNVLKKEGLQMQAEGDLNKDGYPDFAAILEKKDGSAAPPRALFIALAHPDHSYSLSIKADDAVLKADEGGVWGDPFESLSIDRGSVLITHYGGSNWRWYNQYRFRYQDNDWFLIGATHGSYFNGTAIREEADEEDYNLLTGDYMVKKKDDSGKLVTTKGNGGKKTVKLKDFKLLEFMDKSLIQQ